MVCVWPDKKTMTEQQLLLEDSRRLTGPNMFGPDAGAIIDVLIDGFDKQTVINCWQQELRRLLTLLGWQSERDFHRQYAAGASLGFTAPIDVLYAATEVNEVAWQRTVNHFNNEPQEPLEPQVEKLLVMVKEEANPALLALQAAAKTHDVRFLSDDDHVSIGYGAGCQVFPVNNIPDASHIDWTSIASVPLALVTGTNGKSTTVRLAAHVIKTAGIKCGITSTDYIRIDEQILDTGDYSGPGGARTLLRHPETEMALLEVARGGMLRRGLGVNQALCAAITNVAADHLGDYGIDTVDDMIEAKFVVRQALNNHQDLILNADDQGVVKMAATLPNQLVWFSWDVDNPVVLQHISKGGKATYVEDGVIHYHDPAADQPTIKIIAVEDIPITMSGAAKHNVHNALAVVAMMFAMGIEVGVIQSGLKTFASSPENNPGRGNLFTYNDFKVLVDFAHNEHGLAAMATTLKNMPANRRLLLIGQAGDRDDALIKGLVKSGLMADPDCLVICELRDYLRGRKPGEVPVLIEQFALELGMKKSQIIQADSPLEGTKKALDWARSGDVLLILSLTQRDEVIQLLQKNQ